MKVKYRIVVEVESDNAFEDTPDKWDMSDLFDAPAEFISYTEVEEKNLDE